MKIENKLKENTVNIKDVFVGGTFRWNSIYFIKTEEENTVGGYVCVDLETGELSIFYDGTMVQPFSATLVIE
jgi:hypothetical protein